MALTGKQKAGIGVGVVIAVIFGLMGAASAAEDDDEEKVDEDDSIDVFNSVFSNTPKPGKLYLIKKGDNFSTIAKKALNAAVSGSGKTYRNQMKYMKCISSSKWNRTLYGIVDDFTKNFPQAHTSPDNLSIRSSFYPRHQDARGAIIRREAPVAGVKEGKYALLWLPFVSKDALIAAGEPDCANQKYEDGRSGLEPPKVLYDLWEKA